MEQNTTFRRQGSKSYKEVGTTGVNGDEKRVEDHGANKNPV